MPVATPRKSVWGQSLDAIAERIAKLGLQGMDSRRIVVMKQPFDRKLQQTIVKLPDFVRDGKPACVVAMSTERIRSRIPGNVARKEYGCPVYFLRSNQNSATKNLDEMLWYREQVVNEFNEGLMPEVAHVYKTTVETGVIFPPGLLALGYDASVVTIRAHSCERLQ